MIDIAATSLFETFEAERPRLVRLCTQLSGNPALGDELAQETLVEAWKNSQKLTDPLGVSAWLSAIARNVCLRSRRNQGREISRIQDEVEFSDADTHTLARQEFDFETELDRSELLSLLDRALELLPADTRAALVSHYMAESPLAEVAGQLGLSEGLVAVRLHRGKIALKKIITSQFRRDALAFGLIESDVDWQETRLWCPDCGERKLLGELDAANGILRLKCPLCDRDRNSMYQNSERLIKQIDGAKGYKTALTRIMLWADDYYLNGLRRGESICTFCGRTVRTVLKYSPESKSHFVDSSCPACNSVSTQSVMGSALGRGLEFWRKHPRLRALPERAIAEVDGVPALHVGFESVTNSARFDVVMARDTLTVLRLSQNG